MTKNSAQKPPSTYTRVIHKDLTQAIQEISMKSVRKTEFINPVRIVFEFRLFLAHSSSTKKFEIINFEWLNPKLLELISIVSSDCRTDIFSFSFAAVYDAELLFS